jgi:hypothetical protein
MITSNQNFSIPVPPFEFHSFIKLKADEFCGYQFREPWHDSRHAIEKVKGVIWDFFSNEHKVQFLGHLVNYTIESYMAHEKICKHPETCAAERKAQDVLYYLYGELKDAGINVDFNSFTTDEIINNNLILNNIDSDLAQMVISNSQVIGNAEIIEAIENLRADLKSMPELYSLGKKKWYQTLTGIVAEYSINKSLDFVLAGISPQLSGLYHTIKIFIAGLLS